MTNGEKREFKDKLILAIKLLFSNDLLAEVAQELEAEELQRRSARDAAREAQAAQQHGDPERAT